MSFSGSLVGDRGIIQRVSKAALETTDNRRLRAFIRLIGRDNEIRGKNMTQFMRRAWNGIGPTRQEQNRARRHARRG